MDKLENIIKVHICGVIDDLKIKSIFPEPCSQKVDNTLIGDYQWKTEQFNWIAKIYQNKNNEQNFKDIYNVIQKDSNSYKMKKHVILSFGDEDNNILFDLLYDIGIVYLPRFIFVTKKEGNYDFTKKMFITNIVYAGLSEKEIVINLQSELWEIDCYYNEKGNQSCSYLANNILEKIEVSDSSINILLAGISRAGKSSFINIMANKLLALENCEKSSITSRISEYQIYGQNKTEKAGFLKIIDTPGFNYETNKSGGKGELVDLEQINEGIFNLIEEYKQKSSGENIHFVLFFFIEGTPLQGTQRVLDLFMREGYHVLFIINKSINEDDHGKSSDIKSTIKFLKNNGLDRLADEKNIITCNLINSKKSPGYGIDDIFKRIFNILTSKNGFYQDKEILKKLKDCNEQLNNYYNVSGKEEEYKKFFNEGIELKKLVTQNNDLFKKYHGEENIIDEGRKNAEKNKKIYIGLTASQAYIPIPYTDLALTPVLQGRMIYLILTGYGLSITNIDLTQFINFLFKGGAREIGHVGVNYASKQILKNTAKGCLMEIIKKIASEQGGKTATETLKFIPFFGYFVGATIGAGINFYFTKNMADNCISFCECYLRSKGSLEFVINKLEILNNIFKELEKLSKKQNWWDYKTKLIKKIDNNEEQ